VAIILKISINSFCSPTGYNDHGYKKNHVYNGHICGSEWLIYFTKLHCLIDVTVVVNKYWRSCRICCLWARLKILFWRSLNLHFHSELSKIRRALEIFNFPESKCKNILVCSGWSSFSHGFMYLWPWCHCSSLQPLPGTLPWGSACPTAPWTRIIRR